jgi:D-alanyl-lipoteichoic acid acyltransferase DltB (MBOAT superfamily)
VDIQCYASEYKQYVQPHIGRIGMFIRNDAPDSPANLLWRTMERTFLCVVVFSAAATFVYDGISLSQRVADKEKIAGLGPSPWVEGWKADVNDGQLRSFRDGLPLLIVVAVTFVVGRSILTGGKTVKSSLQFYAVVGPASLVYLHGFGVIYLFMWLFANFAFAKACRGMRLFPLTVWIVNLSFLILTEYYEGYGFKWLGLESLERLYHPDMPWHRTSNLCFLKLLSYLMDSNWAALGLSTATKEKHMQKCHECSDSIECLRYRQDTHAEDYSALAFTGYVTYFPLYLAGPTLSYNAWRSQVQRPQQTYNLSSKLWYFSRLLFAYFLLELSVHFLYLPAIANNPRNKKLWAGFNAYELAISSYLILMWIWLKFLFIWRFFRLWAICDGIESPENMGRCITSTYCIEGFWRMWHRAFNQWLVRYLFVPLGGSRYKVYNVWVVFGFVAIWHDLRLHLLVWGWGMCLFIVPEVLSKAYFSRPRFSEFRKTALYNWLCAMGCAIFMITLIVTNLIGFSFGLQGLNTIWEEVVRGQGLVLLVKAWIVSTFVIHLTFSFRRSEGASKGY